ncbi:sensor histidine kinase [Microbacterium sp. CFH 31415]|uniref:sensor histidine kinase n=1 Tax=Microbacterium sp. CFH 31415 TaxID=2921732 RepID=UPI001F148B8E|nr:sensor histidine kinase [Microbacterium sp. CFH 31415]MCH6230955.1 sensor histidine kinase [Microbacterium sp. CFH 31415]
MLDKRWWDIAVVAGSASIAMAIAFGLGPGGAAERVVAYAAIAAFALAYFLIARPAIGTASTLRFATFLTTTAVILAIGTASTEFLATLQVLAYPLAWVLGDTRRRGVIGSAVIALAVMVGYTFGGGFSIGAFVAGVTTAGFSFAFATAFGLWISGIAEYGEERARLLDELTAAQAEVRALSHERGASEERERLARDIHDTLAQSLAGLVILAERAGRQSREGAADAATATLATVEQVARDALDEARALVARTAAVPDEAALGAAIERLAERFRAQSGAAIDVSVDATAEALDRDRQVVLLRCAQEGLSNVARHAQATLATVAVRVADGAATLEITDDGRGFDPAASGTGFGIDGMGDRVALAGGTFEVDSAPGAGTTVRVRLPLGAGAGAGARAVGGGAPADETRTEVTP